jgi:hypothetical protein
MLIKHVMKHVIVIGQGIGSRMINWLASYWCFVSIMLLGYWCHNVVGL